MCLAVCHPRPGVGVVRIPLRVQMVEKHVHLVLGQKGGHGLHVVVTQAVVMSVRVLAIQDGVMVRHPPRLVGRCDFHGELCGLCALLFSASDVCRLASVIHLHVRKAKKRFFLKAV